MLYCARFLITVEGAVVSKKRDMDLEQIKKDLLGRKVELEEILADLSSSSKEDQQGQDLGDQALSSSMDTLRQSLQNSEHTEYQMILGSLKAIDNGSYGVCTDCDSDISEKRLKYYPNASRCISCQEVLEEQS